MLWRIHEAIFKERIKEAENIIESFGDDVQVVTGSLHQLPNPPPNNGSVPALAVTTLDDIRFKVGSTQLCPWSFYSDRKFNASYWLPRLLHSNIPALNSDSCFLPFGMLNNRQFPVFVKPNSGNKQFTGQVIENVEQLKHIKLDPETICLVSQPKTINSVEWRLWVVNEEVIACSPYSWDDLDLSKLVVPSDVIDIATQVATKIHDIDVTYVVDVVFNEDMQQYTVNEINSTTTSGVYAVDLRALLSSLRTLAYQEWNNLHAFE